MFYIQTMNVNSYINEFAKVCISITFLSCAHYSVSGQELISAQGAHLENSNASLSFSLGEVFTNTYTTTDQSVVSGIQQPNPSGETINLDVSQLDQQLAIYPNPFSTHLQIEQLDLQYSKLNFKIHHISGNQIAAGTISQKKSTIAARDYPSGGYIITLTDPKSKLSVSQLLIKK